MASMREIYVQKCSDFTCDPIGPVLEILDAGRPLDVVALDGKSKELFQNRVKPMQVFALCETLYDYSLLRILRLPYNFLNDMAAQAIARLLQVAPGIQLLDLTGNEVTAEGVAALTGVLARPEAGLQALMLRNNPLGDPGLLSVASMLSTNSSLTLLDLADTRCGVPGLIAIANALTDSNTSLQILDLEDTQIQGPQDATYKHLARMLAVNASVTDLSLAKQRMTDTQLDLLVTYGFARSAANWTVLSLRANKLSPFAGPVLERLLSYTPQLQRLNLASNMLGNDGAVALSRCLPGCTALRELDVRSNAIGDVGLGALAGVLHMVRTLQLFLLWGNNFGPGASRAMADALAHPILRSLRTDVRPYVVDGEVSLALKDA